MSDHRVLQFRWRHAVALTAFITVCASVTMARAEESVRRFPLGLEPEDVIATGNEWIALPAIRSTDAALESFNVLSMRDRGLLEVVGENGAPVLKPYFTLDGRPLPFRNPSWELIEYWIPVAHLAIQDLDLSLTYCAPSGSRAAFIRMTVTNRRSRPALVSLGLRASWGALNRVTYTPVALRGERTITSAPWVDSAEVFSFITHDTQFAWSLIHPGAKAQLIEPPLAVSPTVDAQRSVNVAPGETAEADFVLGVGIEEFSASHSAKALREMLDREGADQIINQAASWCRQRTRTTGRADLDLLMNRNFLFTALYAWGRTIDTEQLVGVTSRSPRYYVSAAYWDRDAMLWSFPGLLDVDPSLAREALDYALTVQLGNTGVHSRFIDGIVLEDGLELDEVVAPIIAMAAYVNRTGDDAFLVSHRSALLLIHDRLLDQFDPQTGLYASLQDAQDEYQKLPFITYDNVLTWRTLLDFATLFDRMKDPTNAQSMRQKAESLQKAIMKYCVSANAPAQRVQSSLRPLTARASCSRKFLPGQ